MTNPEDTQVIKTPKTPNPLYTLAPNDGTHVTITHVQLKGGNYEEWAKGFRVALGAKRKVGFINGSVEQPSQESGDLEDWMAVNYTIIAWIFNTIEPNLRSTISYRETAYDLWEDIKQRFTVGNGIKVYQLRTDITNCKQYEGETIMAYYGRIKKLWDDKNDYDAFPSCTCTGCKCDINKTLRKRREVEQIQEFLMGLESCYSNVRSSILGIEPLPSLHSVYSRISQEQEVKTLTQRQTEATSMAFAVKTGPNAGFKNRGSSVHCNYCNKNGHSEDVCYLKNDAPRCSFCNKHGHTEDVCATLNMDTLRDEDQDGKRIARSMVLAPLKMQG